MRWQNSTQYLGIVDSEWVRYVHPSITAYPFFSMFSMSGWTFVTHSESRADDRADDHLSSATSERCEKYIVQSSWTNYRWEMWGLGWDPHRIMGGNDVAAALSLYMRWEDSVFVSATNPAWETVGNVCITRHTARIVSPEPVYLKKWCRNRWEIC